MSASKSRRQKQPRELALDILTRVDQKGSYAVSLLDAALKNHPLEQRDRALLTELVYGSLRWRGRIDWLAQRFLAQPLSRMNPFLRNGLRLMLYQVLFLSKVPEYAAVNEGVELAKRRAGQKGAALLNAVVRNILRQKEDISLPSADEDAVEHLAVLWSHPNWLIRLWLEYFPKASVAELLAANNRAAPVTLRVNSLRGDRQTLLRKLHVRGIKAVPSRWSPQAIRLNAAAAVAQLPGYQEGLFQVQGEASQLVGYLVDPQPEERVLDACAAPGGKTTHLAELMKDQGEVMAMDSSSRGLEKVRENVQRLGLTSVRFLRCDATRGVADGCARVYDRILVDAPCTGLGTLRLHPEAKWRRQLADVKRLSELQARILESLVGCLKPGGILVYATCTLTPDENEGVVTNFLQNHREMTLEDAGALLPEGAKTMIRGKFFLALPHKHDTDGFFAARMRRAA